jgi:chromosome segregation ATPase
MSVRRGASAPLIGRRSSSRLDDVLRAGQARGGGTAVPGSDRAQVEALNALRDSVMMQPRSLREQHEDVQRRNSATSCEDQLRAIKEEVARLRSERDRYRADIDGKRLRAKERQVEMLQAKLDELKRMAEESMPVVKEGEEALTGLELEYNLLISEVKKLEHELSDCRTRRRQEELDKR